MWPTHRQAGQTNYTRNANRYSKFQIVSRPREVSVTDDDFPRLDVNPYWQFKPTKNEPFILDLDDGDT